MIEDNIISNYTNEDRVRDHKLGRKPLEFVFTNDKGETYKIYDHKGVVYQVFNTKSSINRTEWKSYIGVTTGTLREVMADHKLCYTDSSFHKAIREYGFDAFKWQIIKYKEDWETFEDLQKIKHHQVGKYHYNLRSKGYNDDEDDCHFGVFTKNRK